LRGAIWSHQQSPVRGVPKNPDRLNVQVQHVSAANRAMYPAVHPGDFPKTLAASVATSSATRAGETGSSASTAPVPSKVCPRAFQSRPTPAPPPFQRRSWRSAQIASCSARSVTTDRTSGRMANSSAMDPPCLPQRARPRSDPGRSRFQQICLGCLDKNADGPGREGGTGPPVGGLVGLLGSELAHVFYATQSPISRLRQREALLFHHS
jgi:hypothetical protein